MAAQYESDIRVAHIAGFLTAADQLSPGKLPEFSQQNHGITLRSYKESLFTFQFDW